MCTVLREGGVGWYEWSVGILRGEGLRREVGERLRGRRGRGEKDGIGEWKWGWAKKGGFGGFCGERWRGSGVEGF